MLENVRHLGNESFSPYSKWVLWSAARGAASGEILFNEGMSQDRFQYEETFQLGEDDTRYRSLGKDGLRVESFQGEEVLVVEPSVLERLAREAVRDVSFLLRTKHQR